MKYPYDVKKTQVENHVFWVAVSKCLKGCIGQGDSIEEAVSELQINEDEWIETATKFDIPIPDIQIETLSGYSGKLTLRISPHEHELAANMAKKEGVSLNQYISDAVIARNHEMVTMDCISNSVATFSKNLHRLFSLSETVSSSPSSMVYSLYPHNNYIYAEK